MKNFIISTVLAFISLLAIDAVWLGVMQKLFYAKRLEHLMAEQVNLGAALVFYILYPIAISLFITSPAVEQDYSWMKTAFYGAMFGLVAYGTYDLTNLATLKNWPLSVTVVDMIWGALLTAACSLIAVAVMKRFFS